MMGEKREGVILEAFVDLADSLVHDFDQLDFLYRLLDHSLPLTGAEAGAVLLHYEGRLHLVASSDEGAEAVELLEVQSEQGPARECFVGATPVSVERIAEVGHRWPDFVRAARPYRWSSALAVPLRLRDFCAGSFVTFWAEDGPAGPSDDDAKVLQAFADVATIAVLHRRATAGVEAVVAQLHTALESRVRVEQAKGMVAQATGTRTHEAFEMIRDHARSTRSRVTDVAAALIAGELTIAALSPR